MLVGTLGMIMTSPGQTYAVSIFIKDFIADLGLNRSLASTLYTIGTLIGSFALPLVGRQTPIKDRDCSFKTAQPESLDWIARRSVSGKFCQNLADEG